MFGAGGISFANAQTLYYLKSYAVLLVMAIVGATPVVKTLAIKFSESKKLSKVANIIEPAMIVVLFFVVTAFLVDSSSNPFLYFRF
jgi:alginate O-acetyltransferase complex protein AlgI